MKTLVCKKNVCKKRNNAWRLAKKNERCSVCCGNLIPEIHQTDDPDDFIMYASVVYWVCDKCKTTTTHYLPISHEYHDASRLPDSLDELNDFFILWISKGDMVDALAELISKKIGSKFTFTASTDIINVD